MLLIVKFGQLVKGSFNQKAVTARNLDAYLGPTLQAIESTNGRYWRVQPFPNKH